MIQNYQSILFFQFYGQNNITRYFLATFLVRINVKQFNFCKSKIIDVELFQFVSTLYAGIFYFIVFLTLLGYGGHKAPTPPYQFFRCNFRNAKIIPQKLSDFQFQVFCHTFVKFQGHNQCQSQTIELKPRAPFKKNCFCSQIFIKFRFG